VERDLQLLGVSVTELDVGLAVPDGLAPIDKDIVAVLLGVIVLLIVALGELVTSAVTDGVMVLLGV
jgi:hypothetical protein